MSRKPAGAAPLGEFEFIAERLEPLARGFPGALTLGDDAALIDPPPGRQLVVAKDALVAGVHFLEGDPPASVARKLLRTNLSDLAAMGADPLAYLTAIARPGTLAAAWYEAFANGLEEDQRRFGLHLIGGDTVSTTGPLVLSLTIIGSVPAGEALLRSGAGVGDRVFVSGTLGDAALGLRVLQGLAADDDQALYLTDRYRNPRPRLKLGRRLRGVASAAIDVSDGLLADLGHICARSGVGAEVALASLPLSDVARGMPGAVAAALAGGDDYELLFTVPEAAADGFDRTGITEIGRITAGERVRVTDATGREVDVQRRGWRHF
ncbi:MAG: thiamine-phosphate kinase [Geminicoccaceae bacterium]|nr:thiamine-phosphate kinase [Geminicoccaceae bacterium]